MTTSQPDNPFALPNFLLYTSIAISMTAILASLVCPRLQRALLQLNHLWARTLGAQACRLLCSEAGIRTLVPPPIRSCKPCSPSSKPQILSTSSNLLQTGCEPGVLSLWLGECNYAFLGRSYECTLCCCQEYTPRLIGSLKDQAP